MRNHIWIVAATLMLTTILTGVVSGAMLSPEVRRELEKNGRFDDYVELFRASKINGVNAPSVIKNTGKLSMSAGTVDTLHVLVLLVDFDDNPYTGGKTVADPVDFDSILFSTDGVNPTGSMTEYYSENSYGNIVILGDVRGWYRMPQSYSYYVDDRAGIGSVYPQNSRGLARDAVNAAEADGVDFSRYDTYGANGPDGEIDGLMIVHAGPGFEKTGDNTDMQSHKWDLGIYYQFIDGIKIDVFTIQPEEYPTSKVTSEISPIGVFCHEFGHVLGLPDLYDIDYEPVTSAGVGQWSLMASGCYLGDARRPAHLDAWSKTRLGFVSPIEVHENMADVEIPQVETNPVIYKLWKDGEYGDEYFLIENRSRTGFDCMLPGEGLMIYHVDETATYNNINVDHYHVAVEQADGLFQIELAAGNSGDNGDPWPGAQHKRSFDDLSIPSGRGYGGYISEVSVWNISDPGEIMTANFDVEWSRPHISLEGYDFFDANGNGFLEAGESVEFYFRLKNSWLTATDVEVSIGSNFHGIEYTRISRLLSSVAGDGVISDNVGGPLTFTLPDTLVPTYDSFFVSVEINNGGYDTIFAIERQIGRPQILIVDDDRGGNYEELYFGDLYRKQVPAEMWHKDIAGSPPAEELGRYNIVFWFTGDTCASGTTYFSAADIDAIEKYLDGGGNLFLSGQGLARQLETQDAAFLENYLHAAYGGALFHPNLEGVSGSYIGHGLSFRFLSYSNMQFEWGEKIIPLEDAVPAFNYAYSPEGYNSLTYTGPYKLVFLDFCYEALDNSSGRYDTRDTLLFNILNFFGEMKTQVADEGGYGMLPEQFTLGQNYPNPFNPATTIQYTIYSGSGVYAEPTTLKIFNILGREVRTLIDEAQSPGTYTVVWDGLDDGGVRAASGIYFYRLKRGDASVSKKMILLK